MAVPRLRKTCHPEVAYLVHRAAGAACLTSRAPEGKRTASGGRGCEAPPHQGKDSQVRSRPADLSPWATRALALRAVIGLEQLG